MIWEVECERDRFIEDNDTASEDEEESFKAIEKALENATGKYVVLPEDRIQ